MYIYICIQSTIYDKWSDAKATNTELKCELSGLARSIKSKDHEIGSYERRSVAHDPMEKKIH